MQYSFVASHVVTSLFAVKSWYAHGTVVAAAPLLDDDDVLPLLEDDEELVPFVTVQAPLWLISAVLLQAYVAPPTQAL